MGKRPGGGRGADNVVNIAGAGTGAGPGTVATVALVSSIRCDLSFVRPGLPKRRVLPAILGDCTLLVLPTVIVGDLWSSTGV